MIANLCVDVDWGEREYKNAQAHGFKNSLCANAEGKQHCSKICNTKERTSVVALKMDICLGLSGNLPLYTKCLLIVYAVTNSTEATFEESYKKKQTIGKRFFSPLLRIDPHEFGPYGIGLPFVTSGRSTGLKIQNFFLLK